MYSYSYSYRHFKITQDNLIAQYKYIVPIINYKYLLLLNLYNMYTRVTRTRDVQLKFHIIYCSQYIIINMCYH